MPDYKKMYYKAFSALTNVDKLMQQASTIICAAQMECEDLFAEEEQEAPQEDD